MLIQYLIPVYNEAQHVRSTLDSILLDSATEIEVIISDNCSNDGTYEICREIEQGDKRVRVHRQSSNIGPALNFEYLTRNCTATYAHFVGAHDQIGSNYSTSLVHYLRAHNNSCHFVLPNYYWFSEQEARQEWPMERVNEQMPLYSDLHPAIRYLAGIRYWPCWWFYSCVRADILKIVMHNISDTGILNKDSLAVSHLLYISKPSFLHDLSYYGRMTLLDSSRGDYNRRANIPGGEVTAGHYRDMLYWAITYLYHYGRILSNSNTISSNDIRRCLSMAAVELVRIYPGSLSRKNRSWILFEMIDYMSLGKSYHGY